MDRMKQHSPIIVEQVGSRVSKEGLSKFLYH